MGTSRLPVCHIVGCGNLGDCTIMPCLYFFSTRTVLCWGRASEHATMWSIFSIVMESTKDHSDFTFPQNLSGIFHVSFYILCLSTVAWAHNMFSQKIRQHLNLHLVICDCLYLPIIQTFLYSVLWLKVKQEICHSMLYSWCLKRSIWNLETHIYREIHAQLFYFLYF